MKSPLLLSLLVCLLGHLSFLLSFHNSLRKILRPNIYNIGRISPLAEWIECSPMLLGNQGSISGRVIPKTQKKSGGGVLDASLLNTQHYKVWIKDKWRIQRKKLRPPLHLVVAIEKGTFGLPLTTVTNLLTYI